MTLLDVIALLVAGGILIALIEYGGEALERIIRARADARLIRADYDFADLYLVATEAVRRGRLVGEDAPEELIDRMANTVLEDLEAGILSPHGDPAALER